MSLIYEEIKRFLGQFQDVSIRESHAVRRYELERATHHIEEQFESRDARITSLLAHNNDLLERARGAERASLGKQITITSLEAVLADYTVKFQEINKQARFLDALLASTAIDASTLSEIITLSDSRE